MSESGNPIQDIAEVSAAYAHLAYLSSRRGILPSDGHYLICYDSNPYEGRSRELAALIAKVEARGIKLLARATHGGGYTEVLIFENEGDNRKDIILNVWQKILFRSIAT